MARLKKITVLCGDDIHRVHLIQMRAFITETLDELEERAKEIARSHNWSIAEELRLVGVIEGLVQFSERWDVDASS
jgi:hypothetical protein